mmetsp:Transcript_19937/g.23615  ORF Transcript_19937/g.23615 Transcript_19937/m.23615 type:complete len:109 (-) Transcript_19937:792-1118(-)
MSLIKPRETANLIEPVRQSVSGQSTTKSRFHTTAKKQQQQQQRTSMKTETFTSGGITRTVTKTTTTTKNLISSVKKNSISNSLTVTKPTQSSTMRTKSAIKGNATRTT